MKHYAYGLCVFTLIACQPEHQESASTPNTAAQNIASAILNTPQQNNILHTKNEAVFPIDASDIALIESASVVSVNPKASDTNNLPETCHQYYQRAKYCFSKQNQADALIQLLQEQETELQKEQPNEATCQALNHSFDDLAQHLQCP